MGVRGKKARNPLGAGGVPGYIPAENRRVRVRMNKYPRAVRQTGE